MHCFNFFHPEQVSVLNLGPQETDTGSRVRSETWWLPGHLPDAGEVRLMVHGRVWISWQGLDIMVALSKQQKANSNLIPMVVHAYSVMSDSATLWPVACQAPLSMEFSRQEYQSGLPISSPGDFPDPGIEPVPLVIGRWILYH